MILSPVYALKIEKGQMGHGLSTEFSQQFRQQGLPGERLWFRKDAGALDPDAAP
jgi:hypothetical protein